MGEMEEVFWHQVDFSLKTYNGDLLSPDLFSSGIQRWKEFVQSSERRFFCKGAKNAPLIWSVMRAKLVTSHILSTSCMLLPRLNSYSGYKTFYWRLFWMRDTPIECLIRMLFKKTAAPRQDCWQTHLAWNGAEASKPFLAPGPTCIYSMEISRILQSAYLHHLRDFLLTESEMI